jgi:hypothetical protein
MASVSSNTEKMPDGSAAWSCRRGDCYLAECDSLAPFRAACMIFARHAKLDAWVASQERRGLLRNSQHGGA